MQLYCTFIELIFWLSIVGSIWFLWRHWLVIAYNWFKNTILLLLQFSYRRFPFKCNTITWGFHITFGHKFRYKVIVRITRSSFEWAFWLIIRDCCWNFWNSRIVCRYVVYVVIISSRSFGRMCGLTASIWGWGVRGRGSSSSRMNGVQVNPCLSFLPFFFFLSWNATKSAILWPRGVAGSEPLLSISSSSLGTMLSRELFNLSP